MNIRSYLAELDDELHLERHERSEIIAEIRTHMEDRTAELENQGVPHQTATERAMQDLGTPHELGKAYYSSHSSGSWRDVILAMLPHMAVASIFALHLWTHLFWMVAALILVSIIAVGAWRMGRPQWAYPWFGYALAAPALSWMLTIAAIGYGVWTFVTGGSLPLAPGLYLGMALGVPVTLFITIRIARKLVLHDWLVVSLAALPLPLIATWLFLLHWHNGLVDPDQLRAVQVDASTALVFVALGLTTAVYMLLGQRRWRIALTLVAVPILAASATAVYQTHAASFNEFSAEGAFDAFASISHQNPGLLPTMLAFVLTAAFLTSPMLLNPLVDATRRLRDARPTAAAS
jgi:hypothetical protein